MKTDTSHFYVDWISMNAIAQQLLGLKRYEDAKLLAETNVTEFPDKDLVMVTMANIYLALGEKENAIRFYNKALKITPTYEEAKNRLKELK
jgi:tetratricopeptide (TPR) repeat protein